MWKYFIRQKELLEKIEVLKQLLLDRNNAFNEVHKQLEEQKNKKIGPELVVERVMAKSVGFYKYEKLNHEAQKDYYLQAQSLLHNDVFKNEIEHMITDWVEFIAYKSQSHESTRDMRMCINALELFKQRARSIVDPDKRESYDDLNAAI